MKITPVKIPGANERTIRTAGTNRLQHRIRFTEGLDPVAKTDNIPNNGHLAAQETGTDRNNSVTQLIRYMKNSFRLPVPAITKKDEAMRDFIVPLTRSQGRAARPYGINPGKRHGNARRPPAAG